MDWNIAKPLPDGSDTASILHAANMGRYAGKQVEGNGPRIWPDGRARWAQLPESPSPEFVQLPPADPRVVDSLKLLDLWPEARKQCADILLALAPLGTGRSGGHGCACGNYRDDFGWIYVTADDAWGFAEGVVHEMAHWKLRALGILFEEWDDLLLDHSTSELYTSPVRKDKPRPMGAVLHAQYSYIHVAQMTTLMLKAKPEPDGGDKQWLEVHLKRITEGQGTLRAHARGTAAGQEFLLGLDAWTTEVIAAGREALA